MNDSEILAVLLAEIDSDLNYADVEDDDLKRYLDETRIAALAEECFRSTPHCVFKSVWSRIVG